MGRCKKEKIFMNSYILPAIRIVSFGKIKYVSTISISVFDSIFPFDSSEKTLEEPINFC